MVQDIKMHQFFSFIDNAVNMGSDFPFIIYALSKYSVTFFISRFKTAFLQSGNIFSEPTDFDRFFNREVLR